MSSDEKGLQLKENVSYLQLKNVHKFCLMSESQFCANGHIFPKIQIQLLVVFIVVKIVYLFLCEFQCFF